MQVPTRNIKNSQKIFEHEYKLSFSLYSIYFVYMWQPEVNTMKAKKKMKHMSLLKLTCGGLFEVKNIILKYFQKSFQNFQIDSSSRILELHLKDEIILNPF